MPQVTENTFERLSLEIKDQAEELILYGLLQLRQISERLVENPDASINERRELIRAQNEWEDYISEAEGWLEDELADSYMRGIERANSMGGAVTAGAFSSVLLTPDNPPIEPSEKIVERFNKYPEHIDTFSRFKASAREQLRETRLPIVRQQGDRIRDIIAEASATAYREGDTFTRRQFSQELMRRFSDEGMTGVTYSNGRRVQLDSYSEMVARTQTQQAYNQANWNRLQERGMDLVVISVHYPCSDLCEPHQGEVHSISGNTTEYPTLEGAIADGLFHPNCRHHSSGWTEGAPKPDQDTSTEDNEEMYDAQKRQRQIERNIRHYKRREIASVNPNDREKAKKLVRKWQGEARENIKSNDFLRRAYHRESVTSGDRKLPT